MVSYGTAHVDVVTWHRRCPAPVESVSVGFLEGLAGEPRGQDCGEVRAVEQVVVLAAQRVLEGDPGRLGLVDALIELGELVPGQVSPGAVWLRSRGEECCHLCQGEDRKS